MQIIFFSFRKYEATGYEASLPFIFYEEALSQKTLKLAEGSSIISCFVNDQLDATILRPLAASGLKMIALRCAGFNHVDLNVAKELGIVVCRVPEYSPFAVAEHAVALLQTLNRKIHKAYNRVREGNFSIEGLIGFDIHAKTIGVIGLGKIGKIFTRILLGFGARVVGFDPYPDPDFNPPGYEQVSLDQIWKESDIISLHCPLTPETYHIISDASLQKMKDGIFLINTSRGGLVDSKAAITGLKSGKISALALDVYEEESGIFFYDHSGDLLQDDVLARLMTFPNVLITSHQAFLTHTALENIASITKESIHCFMHNQQLRYRIGI